MRCRWYFRYKLEEIRRMKKSMKKQIFAEE